MSFEGPVFDTEDDEQDISHVEVPPPHIEAERRKREEEAEEGFAERIKSFLGLDKEDEGERQGLFSKVVPETVDEDEEADIEVIDEAVAEVPEDHMVGDEAEPTVIHPEQLPVDDLETPQTIQQPEAPIITPVPEVAPSDSEEVPVELPAAMPIDSLEDVPEVEPASPLETPPIDRRAETELPPTPVEVPIDPVMAVPPPPEMIDLAPPEPDEDEPELPQVADAQAPANDAEFGAPTRPLEVNLPELDDYATKAEASSYAAAAAGIGVGAGWWFGRRNKKRLKRHEREADRRHRDVQSHLEAQRKTEKQQDFEIEELKRRLNQERAQTETPVEAVVTPPRPERPVRPTATRPEVSKHPVDERLERLSSDVHEQTQNVFARNPEVARVEQHPSRQVETERRHEVVGDPNKVPAAFAHGQQEVPGQHSVDPQISSTGLEYQLPAHTLKRVKTKSSTNQNLADTYVKAAVTGIATAAIILVLLLAVLLLR